MKFWKCRRSGTNQGCGLLAGVFDHRAAVQRFDARIDAHLELDAIDMPAILLFQGWCFVAVQIAHLNGVMQRGVGDTVTLWGGAGEMYLSADEVAAAAGTVAYELFCGLAARVPVIEIN